MSSPAAPRREPPPTCRAEKPRALSRQIYSSRSVTWWSFRRRRSANFRTVSSRCNPLTPALSPEDGGEDKGLYVNYREVTMVQKHNGGRLIQSVIFGVIVLTLTVLHPAFAQEGRSKIRISYP